MEKSDQPGAGADTLKFSSLSELDFVAFDTSKDDYLVMGSIEAPFYEQNKRAPIDLVAVIDRSGSMGGEKIKLVRTTLEYMVSQLAPVDSLGIVIYDQEIEVVFPITKMNGEGKDSALRAIESITARGSTDLCGGLVQGLKLMNDRKEKSDVAACLVFTDGQANHGVTDRAGILGALADYLNFNVSVSVSRPPQVFHAPQQMYSGQYASMPPPSNRNAVLSTPPTSSNYGALPPSGPAVNNYAALPAPGNYGNFAAPVAAPPPAVTVQTAPVPVAAPPAQLGVQTAPPTSNYGSLPASFVPVGAPPGPPGIRMPPPPRQPQAPTSAPRMEVGPIDGLPCVIHSFGFGSDHDAALLKAISDSGRGMYYFIQNADQIPPAFTDCLAGLLSVFAQEVVMTLEPLNGCEIVKADTKFKVTQEGGVTNVNIGDVQSEEHRDILFRVSVPALPSPMDQFEIAKITLKYLNLMTNQREERVVIASVPRPAAAGRIAEAQVYVDKQRNRINATKAMDEAKALAEKGSMQEARKLVQDAIAEIQKSVSGKEKFCLSLIENLNDVLKGLVDVTSYRNYGSYAMSSYSSAHSQQRANLTSPMYTTSSRTAQASNYVSFSNQAPPGQ
eukprot:TRINITY_DN5688_c0_g1_i1.p1 TRINITY_DN5688_c0_g1~~TRINITY_DN5688_c0_g1_i1.p1  ORF type:complete len:630 (+),score=185.58 TRINITY_DN5688_c0_g1_i1:47-1891(+)